MNYKHLFDVYTHPIGSAFRSTIFHRLILNL